MLEMIHPWFPLQNMDMKKKNNVMDVSSFLLFEATGDSETPDQNASDHDRHHPIFGNNVDVAMAEDDAQSCSYDSSDVAPSADELDDDINRRAGDVDRSYTTHRYDHEEEEEEEEKEECSSVYQRWGGEQQHVGMPLMGHQLKSSVSVDSTKEFELLNEVEKSRLFWETCLAS